MQLQLEVVNVGQQFYSNRNQKFEYRLIVNKSANVKRCCRIMGFKMEGF